MASAVSAYAATTTCRQQYILQYFGEQVRAATTLLHHPPHKAIALGLSFVVASSTHRRRPAATATIACNRQTRATSPTRPCFCCRP
jgi:superfamily II DNA helicase RecQ